MGLKITSKGYNVPDISLEGEWESSEMVVGDIKDYNKLLKFADSPVWRLNCGLTLDGYSVDWLPMNVVVINGTIICSNTFQSHSVLEGNIYYIKCVLYMYEDVLYARSYEYVLKDPSQE